MRQLGASAASITTTTVWPHTTTNSSSLSVAFSLNKWCTDVVPWVTNSTLVRSGNKSSKSSTESKTTRVLSVKKSKRKTKERLQQSKSNMKESSSLKLKENFSKTLRKSKCSKSSISIRECTPSISFSSREWMRRRCSNSKKRLSMSKPRRCRMSSWSSKIVRKALLMPRMPSTVLEKTSTRAWVHQLLVMAPSRSRQPMTRYTWLTSSFWLHCPCLSRAWPKRASRTSRSITIRSQFNFTPTRTAIHRPKKPSKRSSTPWLRPRRSETARERILQQWTAPPPSLTSSSSSQTPTLVTTASSTDSSELTTPESQAALISRAPLASILIIESLRVNALL